MTSSDSTVAQRPPSLLCVMLFLNALALAVGAVWFRGRSLGNIPGLNGDEAWYGLRAWQLLHAGTQGGWQTPTGNPINPLFVGPLALLHLWLPPSIGLLRSVAVASGLAALAINWLCCRWVFDRRTAMISTVVLAILPANIAYSRFAWDASQSLAATLPVLYFALAAARFPNRFGRWIAASILALAIAIWVHPTNVFGGAAIAIVCLGHLRWRKRNHVHGSATAGSSGSARDTARRVNRDANSIVMLMAAGVLLLAWVWTASLAHGPLPERLAQWRGNMRDLPQTPVLLARLFAGETIYRYLAGSRSWFEWPLRAGQDGWGLGAALFWVILFASAWTLWCRSRPRSRDFPDDTLLFAWILEIAAFMLVAGPGAMVVGQERFAICLVGPTVLVMARGTALVWSTAPTLIRVPLAATALLGWPLLADFHAHYFQFIEHTGGEAHLTFRTGAEEPKQAALEFILESAREEEAEGPRECGKLWIVCSEWWNLCPIRYLALPDRAVCVVEPKEASSFDEFHRALDEGHVWFVEFCGTEAQRDAQRQLSGKQVTSEPFRDYSGRPVLCVTYALP